MDYAKISDIFEIKYGNGFELISMEEVTENESGINFVARTSQNFGVSARVKELKDKPPFQPGVLTVSVGGSVLETFLQTQPFYTGYHILILTPKINLSEKELVYYAWCIRKNKYKYSYGRQANKTLKDILIPAKIPTNLQKLEIKKINFSPKSKKDIKLLDRDWKWFSVEEYFDIFTGGDKPKPEEQKGKLVNSIENQISNNGISEQIRFNGSKIFENFISVASIGAGGTAFYHKDLGAIFTRVKALIPKFSLNQYTGQFLVCLLNKERIRYCYGRVLDADKLRKTKLKLPTDSNGQPDWQFMEDYIKSLPYSGAI
jgi:hypothetical protein